MECILRLLIVSILVMLSFINSAQAEEALVYPFATDQDHRVFNDFDGHASYCPGCQGVDYDVVHGTPVYASIAGTVTIETGHPDQEDAQGCNDDNINYGNYVRIESGNWRLWYGHLTDGGITVTNGVYVEAGGIIGYTSNSGYTCGEDYVTNGLGSSYHLHYELEYNGSDVDPYDYLGGVFIIDSDGSYHYPSEVSSSTPTYASLISTARTTDLHTLNKYNARKDAETSALVYPAILVTSNPSNIHWWNYTEDANSFTPSSDNHWRDWGRYTTLVTQDYSGWCSGAIVYDVFGGATRAYVVQCQQWDAWLQTYGPAGRSSGDPIYCGNPITNVYGLGHRWVQHLNHDYWLDPYNLYDNANGCPNEGMSSQHTDFDCNAATDSDYLWAS